MRCKFLYFLRRGEVYAARVQIMRVPETQHARAPHTQFHVRLVKPNDLYFTAIILACSKADEGDLVRQWKIGG